MSVIFTYPLVARGFWPQLQIDKIGQVVNLRAKIDPVFLPLLQDVRLYRTAFTNSIDVYIYQRRLNSGALEFEFECNAPLQSDIPIRPLIAKAVQVMHDVEIQMTSPEVSKHLSSSGRLVISFGLLDRHIPAVLKYLKLGHLDNFDSQIFIAWTNELQHVCVDGIDVNSANDDKVCEFATAANQLLDDLRIADGVGHANAAAGKIQASLLNLITHAEPWHDNPSESSTAKIRD